MAALGHTPTPFCFVIRQFLGFFPGQVHLSEVPFDDIYPVLPRSSWLSLVTSQFPVRCLTSCSRVVHSQDVSQPPEPSFFNYIFQFPWTSFLSDVFWPKVTSTALAIKLFVDLQASWQPLFWGYTNVEKHYYHDRIDNIHAVATECPYCLSSRHISLWHDQLDVLRVNSSLVNLHQDSNMFNKAAVTTDTASVQTHEGHSISLKLQNECLRPCV